MSPWIFALLLQSPWADLRRESPERPDGTEAARAIEAWSRGLGVPEFTEDLRARMRVSAVSAPLILVSAETLVERRFFRPRVEPLQGPEPEGRIPGDADLWSVPAPPPSGFAPVEAVHTMPGSARGAACRSCDGRGRWRCAPCEGSGRRDCGTCRKSGPVACSRCNGTTRIRCGWCQGRGNTFTEGRRRDCPHCTGGRFDCKSCTLGRVPCGPCQGEGRLPCGSCQARGELSCDPCEGKGRVLETTEFVIRLEPHRRRKVLSRLSQELHRSLSLSDTDGSGLHAEGAEVAAALGAIPDAGIREVLARLISEFRTGFAPELIRGSAIRARVYPAQLVGVTYRDRTAELGLLDGRTPGHSTLSDAGSAWLTERASSELRTGSGHALGLAQKALKLNPANVEARRIEAAALRLIEDRARTGRSPRPVPVKVPPVRLSPGDWRPSAIAVLAPIAGLIAVAMALLQMAVKARRRN